MNPRVQREYDLQLKMFVQRGLPFTVYEVTRAVRQSLNEQVFHWEYRQYVHDNIERLYDLPGALNGNGAVVYSPRSSQRVASGMVNVLKAAQTVKPKAFYKWAERHAPGRDGRYTIPAEFVREAGFAPGDVVTFEVRKNRLVSDKNGTLAYRVDNSGNLRVNATHITSDRTRKLTTRLNTSNRELTVLT